MKKLWCIIFGFLLPVIMVACGTNNTKKDIELMGAGDRIHDTFTFANIGVELKEKENNVYEISGSVEKIDNEKIKEEFEIDADVNNVIAIKLSANGKPVIKEKMSVKINGVRYYDAEHMNGSDYTFIVLEAVKNKTASIVVSWNGEDENSYVLQYSENLILK